MGGGGGSLVSCLSVFCRLSVRTSEHSLKLETGTKCQVDGSSFLCNDQIRLCGGKNLHLVAMETSVHPRAAAFSADKLTTESRRHPGLKFNSLEKRL